MNIIDIYTTTNMKKVKEKPMHLLLAIFLLFFASSIQAQVSPPPLNFEEIDNSPSVYPYKIFVTNDTLTDNGDGTATLSIGGGVGVGDVEAVGDCGSGQCFNGTQGTTLTFNNAGGDATLDYDGTDFSFSKPIDITGGLTTSLDITITGSDLTLGAAGVKLTGDGDGAITFLGLGDGFDEDLSFNLDDTENKAVVSSSTGVNEIQFSGLDILVGGGNINTGNIALTVGDATTDSVTITTDGTGDAEVALPNDSIGDAEIDWSGLTTDADFTVTGTVITSVGLDGVGAVDLDYGSADVTDHTFITDGTGNAEIVLPNDSIGDAEVDWGSGAGQIDVTDVESATTVNILLETEIDASSELAALMDDETGNDGSSLLVFNDNPSLVGINMTGNITLNEKGLVLDSAISADGAYSGITEAGTAGATLAFGDLIYFNNDDSRWELVDANLSDGYDKKLGIAVSTGNDGDAITVLLYGKVRADAVFPAMTVGAVQYMSETAGDITGTAPTTTDAATRIIGFANTADELFFCPDRSYYTHT